MIDGATAGARVAASLGRALPLLVVAAAVLTFLPALQGEFLNWDDQLNLVENPNYRGLGWTQLRWMLTTTRMGHWIPLTWASFGVNYVVGGMDPWGYHLGNLLLHAAAALSFYFVARRLLAAAAGPAPAGLRGDCALAAAFAALAFAVHPLRVESVAWITERRDVLSGFFVMLAVLAWLRAVERAPRPHHGWWALSLLAFAASLLSKAQALPLPAALLLLDAYPLGRVRRLGWRQVLVEKVPHGALAVAAAVVSLLALRAGGVEVTPWAEYGPAARVAMVGYSLVFYPAKWLWPADLSPLYELPPRLDPLEPRFLLALAAAALVTAVLVALRRRWPGGLAAWTYSALMLLPVSGVVHAGHQLAHDRYSYLSGLGFALLAGAGFLWVLRAAARGSLRPAMASLALGTAALVLVGWAGAAWRQSHVWRDSETLWRWAQAVDPDCVVCNVNLGEVIMRSPGLTLERARAAEGYFRHATRVDPRRASAHHNLASTLIAQGRLADAVSPLAEVVRLEPRAPEPLARLGLLYVELGREAEAIPVLRQALELSPGLDGVRGALGRALTRRAEALEREGRGAEAAALRREAGTLSTGG